MRALLFQLDGKLPNGEAAAKGQGRTRAESKRGATCVPRSGDRDSLSRKELARKLGSVCVNGPGAYETRLGTRPIAPGLTTHRTRYDSRDCYVFESGKLRILESEERETLAGFPAGWTAGFSAATRARMLGNSVVPAVAFEILREIRTLI